MDDVANLPGIIPIELVYVQRVRLYLGVTMLANISTSDGKELCAWALSVDENPHKPIFRFPRQESPTASYVLATWHRIIRLCYAPVKAQDLEYPMGPWCKGCINNVWDTVLEDPNSGLLSICAAGSTGARLYERRPQNHNQYRYV